MTSSGRGAAEMAAAMAISGTIGWFVVVSGQPVLAVVFWRCVFGAVTLAISCWACGLLRPGVISWRQARLAAIGGVAVVLNWLLLFGAFKRSSIAVATTLYNTQPFMLVGLGVLLFGERPSIAKLQWLVLAFGGVLLMAWVTPDAAHGGGSYSLGMLMALGAAFFYALAAVVAKRLAGVPPILIVLLQAVVGGVMLAPFAGLPHLPIGAGPWAALAILGVVHTGLVFVLLYGALQKLPTHLAGALSFVYPVVAIVVDVAAFGRLLHPLQIAGIAAILLAAAGTTLGWSPAHRSGPRVARGAVD